MRALIALVLGCTAASSSAQPPPRRDTGVADVTPLARTLEQVCSDVAGATCIDIKAFNSPYWPRFATREQCLEGVRADCLRSATAPGVIDPADRLARCALDLYVKPSEARMRAFDECSAKPGEARGALPDGATCFDHAQCAGGSCVGSMVPIAASCGRCARTPLAGDPCADDGACATQAWHLPETDLLCEAGRCVRGAGLGESCAARRCLAPTTCVDGTCQRPVGTQPAGAPCKYPLDCRAGSRCSDLDGLCHEIRIVEMGETCHRRSDTKTERTLLCGAGLYCTPKSLCAPHVALGERCEARDGELVCGWTASCRTASSEDLRVCVAIEELCQ